MGTSKGFIKDWSGNKILPITRGELVLDKDGNIALNSEYFLAGYNGSDSPGLVTAAERAMLSGGGTGSTINIGNLATKLNYINTGLYFNEFQLQFYNDSSTGTTATPIKITANPANGITLTTSINTQDNSHTVSLSLTPLESPGTTISKIIKNITVDNYGRVTSVSGGELTSDDLPTTISGKTINEGILSNCTTQEEEIPENKLSIVNKAYVDKKFTTANAIATGALKFGGPIGSQSEVQNCLNKEHWNTYYKVTAGFSLSTDNFYETLSNPSINVKAGDTIIIYPVNSVAKIVYIPSGDDITTITVRKQGELQDALTRKIGDVIFSFSKVFDVKNLSEGSSTATISLPDVSTGFDGYLSNKDYKEFKSYKSSYENILTEQEGLYNIGKLTIGDTEHIIKGINNISKLTLENGTNDLPSNPKLRFKETGKTDVDITLQGQAGISIKKNGNSIEIGAQIEEKSKPYLTTNDQNQLKVVIGEVNANQTITNGLVDFATFIGSLSLTTTFETITDSLIGTDNTKYKYGNELLKTAITVTI